MRPESPFNASMPAAEPFPLITIQPAVDFNNAWVALLLEGERPLDGAALAHLLHECHLAEVLDALLCVVTVDPARIDPALAAGLPRDRMVLAIPAATGSDPACHPALAALQAAGFALMAVGFPAADAPLFPGIASLAVACPGFGMPAGFAEWLRRLPGPHLALGTTEHVCPGFCKFHWLAGHYAGHASPAFKGEPTARSLLLKLLALVARDADTAEIEALIKRDPNLSYQLLKLVNSVAFSPARQIGNFGQAIAMLGRRQLQRWLQLLLYTRAQGADAASPLLPRAALRAGLMEALARRTGMASEACDQAYMVGMFSLLDALFGEPLAKIIAPLHLPGDVADALIAGAGTLGRLLTLVGASEGQPTPALAGALAAAGIAPAAWAADLVGAVRWAVLVSKEA